MQFQTAGAKKGQLLLMQKHTWNSRSQNAHDAPCAPGAEAEFEAGHRQAGAQGGVRRVWEAQSLQPQQLSKKS